MARIFVSLYNFCKKQDDLKAMPPFFEGFLKGLEKAGNEVVCFQTRKTTERGFEKKIPPKVKKNLLEFNPDLCIFFNNCFWDVTDFLDCPIVIYDVDSPTEFDNKEKIQKNISRYLFIYNQTKGHLPICELLGASKEQCYYIPFYTEIQAEDEFVDKNIVFLGTNWLWKGLDFWRHYMWQEPAERDVEKAQQVIDEFTKYPFKDADEIYQELNNYPHYKIDLGDLRRCGHEISGYRRIKFLEAVSDLGLQINGSWWFSPWVAYYPEVLKCVDKKQIWTLEENQRLYNSAKLAISTKHIQAQDGFSFRILDIMASNACLVAEYCADLEKLFPNVELPMFRTPEEERQLCMELLADEPRRRKIVEAVHQVIDEKYRFSNVLDCLERFLKMNLHSDLEGSLEIRIPWENSQKEIDKSLFKKVHKKLQSLLFMLGGKHLGYDPYGRYACEYVGTGKLIKKLIIDETRSEYYLGLIPLYSLTVEEDGLVRHNLIHEKMKSMLARMEILYKLISKIQSWNTKRTFRPFVYLAKSHHISKIKRKVQRGEKVRVILFVSRTSCWIFGDLYHLLKDSKYFEPIVVVKPFMSRGKKHMIECMRNTYADLETMGYSPVKGYDWDNDTFLDVKKVLKPDMLFYTKFWKPHFHKYFYFNRFRTKVTMLAEYAYIIHGHYEAQNFEMHNFVDVNFYSSKEQADVIKPYMDNHGKNVCACGSLKLRPIFDASYIPKQVWKEQKKVKKKIIWAPHHEDRTGEEMYQYDAFYDLYDVMLEIAEKYKEEIQFAFKPHPLLKVKLIRYWGEDAQRQYYERWENMENTQLEEGEFIDLFLTSDAMILDCISFVAEYSATRKPAMFTLGSHTRVRMNEMGDALLDQMYIAKGDLKNQICSFIEDVVIAGNDVKKQGRDEVVSKYLAQPNELSAAQNVYNKMMEFIQ